MRVINLQIILLATAGLASCGGGGSSGIDSPPVVTPPPVEEPTGLWIRSETAGDGLASYAAKLTQVVDAQVLGARGAPDAAFAEAAPASDGGADSFSSTYTLEANVDEYDVVKYNGSTLAIAPSRSGCCFSVEPFAATDALLPSLADPEGQQIELYRTDPTAGSASLVSVVPLVEGQNAEGMYLSDDRLQVLLSTAWWGAFGDRLTSASGWLDEQVSLLHYDIQDPENPEQISLLTIEGALITSRRTGDEIHIISRHAPNIEGLIDYPQTEEEVAANEEILAVASDEDILPEIRLQGELVTPLALDDCYRVDPEHPLATSAPSDSTLTTFLTVSSETGDILRSACTTEPVSGVYMGDSFIALTHVRWDLETGGTVVHVLERDTLEYVGSEQLEGALYAGGNADFRISEADRVLRLVTTEWTGNPEDAFKHRLFTLAPELGLPELEVLGTLGESGDTRIGKPNEDLYGVRFMSDRAYMVTFERVDPLYVIDLSDASRPTILGELEVPGFSDLLHEVSSQLLLGLGSSERRFPKLELYNISEVARPESQSLFELGAEMDWSYSPAQFNRYAFTYLPGDDVDRFTVPYVAGGVSGDEYVQVDRVALFEIRDKSTPSEATISPVGEVSLAAGSVDSDTRIVLDADALFVISRIDLLGGLWSNPEATESFRSNP